MAPAERIAVALFLTVVLMGAACAGEPLRKLSGGEIAGRLTGMELTDEVHWTYVFGKGGHMTSVSLGTRGAGTWRVRNDELCLDGGPDGARCFEVWKAGRRVELRRDGMLPDDAILQRPQARR
ncbi:MULTISPECIES: hypothetical protein [Methylobacteriaceae]|uniref:hypothetical protein n=1 Tax=Methylobacteriaceae TaxID=119045 RepID=UPI001FEED1D0|nr:MULTISPECIES: hypothetical protein [Methylobacteriaceae]